jgi:DNA-binding NtrC family response regulator
MLLAEQNLPATYPTQEKITILTVSPSPDDHARLRQIFQNQNWRILHAQTFTEAMRAIPREQPSVIVCERTLMDGNWKDLYRQTERIEPAPLLVVMAQDADQNLWAEVLNLGAYDVLAKPLDKGEVVRVVSMAWRQWLRHFQPLARPAFA